MIVLLRRAGFALCLSLALACTDPTGGPGPGPDDGSDDGTTGPQDQITLNGLALKSLSLSKAAVDELALHGLTEGGILSSSTVVDALGSTEPITDCPGESWPPRYLAPDACTGEELESGECQVCPETRGEAARQVLSYLYSCAMPEDAELALEVGGESYTFTGGVGLAPAWGESDDASCDDDCQGWVSACLLARMNDYSYPGPGGEEVRGGQKIEVSLRGDHPALEVTDEVKEEFWQRDASYYGNVFSGDLESNLYGCAGGTYAAQPTITGRFCGAVGEDCPGIEVIGECGSMSAMHCDDAAEECVSRIACSAWDEEGNPTVCHVPDPSREEPGTYRCNQSPLTPGRQQVITTYLKPKEPVCGNGVCELAERSSAEDDVDDTRAVCDEDCAGQWAVSFGSACHEEVAGIGVDGEGGVVVAGQFRGQMDLDGDDAPDLEQSGAGADFFIVKLGDQDDQSELLWSSRIDAEPPASYNDTEAPETITSVAVDDQGAIVVAGTFEGSLDFGSTSLPSDPSSSGPTHLFVARYSSAGSLQWARDFPTGYDHYNSAFSGGGKFPRPQVETDGSGNILFAAHYRLGIDLGSVQYTSPNDKNGHDVVVARLDSNDGAVLGSANFGQRDDELLADLAVSPAGYIALAGRFEGSTSFESESLTAAGRDDGFVLVLEPSLAVSWARAIGDSEDDELLSVAIDGDRNVVVGGYFNGLVETGACEAESSGGHDGLVARFSADGSCAWMSSFGGGVGIDLAREVALDGGEAVVLGQFVGIADSRAYFGDASHAATSGDYPDTAILRYGSSGSVESVRQIGSPVYEASKGLAVAPTGGVVAAGGFMGTINLSGRYLENAGGSDNGLRPRDVFVTRLAD